MPHQAKSPDQYKIVLQQDAPEPMLRAEVGEITPDALLDYSIRLFEHLPIDVYGSDANHAGGVYYRSKVAERMISTLTSYRAKDHTRMTERLKTLFDAGTDPLEIYCKGAHEAGIDYMIQLRMNDLHDVVGHIIDIASPNRSPNEKLGEPYYFTSQWKKDHPEYLLGDPTDDTPSNTYAYWQRSALNYALGKVRAFILDMSRELINNYDLDVFEMDFIRFAFFFRQAEAYAQRHVMTGVVKQIRSICDDVGAKRGRPVRLAARVPDTTELGLRSGIDTAGWLQEGLLDMVTIGGGYTPFGTPWEEIVDVAKKAGVPVLACLNQGPLAKEPKRIYAAAHRAFSAGVTGIKLWNFWYCFDYYHPKGENPYSLEFVNDLVKPESLASKELSFNCDPIQDPSSSIGPAHYHHSWPGQMPMTIGYGEDGIGQMVTFEVPQGALDVRSASHQAQLVLDLINFWAPDDVLELYWNDQRLEGVDFEMRPNEGAEPYRVTYQISCDSFTAGVNRLELRLTKHHPKVDPFISLVHAELTLPGV